MPVKPRQPTASTFTDHGWSPDSASSIVPSADVNWSDAPIELTSRCVLMDVYGDTDTGRTTLALTAPGPIAYIGAFEKTEGILQAQRRKGKEIKILQFGGVMRGSTDEVMRLASLQADRIEAAVSDAFRWARSIILDTETEAWQIFQLARLGSIDRDKRSDKDSRKGQLVYAEINNRWRSMFKQFRLEAQVRNRTNLILISQTGAEYKKNPATGKTEASGKTVRAGQKETAFLCDMVVRTRRSKQGEFSAVIEKPWWNNEVRGAELEDEFLRFDEMMALVTQTDVKEWR